MSLSVKQITDAADEHYKGEYSEGLIGLIDDLWDYQNAESSYEVKGLPTVKFVDAGGAEGDGARKWVVFSVGDQLFRMEGYYSSWGDGEWDGDLVEVKAVQVMRTEYEEI